MLPTLINFYKNAGYQLGNVEAVLIRRDRYISAIHTAVALQLTLREPRQYKHRSCLIRLALERIRSTQHLCLQMKPEYTSLRYPVICGLTILEQHGLVGK